MRSEMTLSPPAGELLFLARTHQSLGIQDHDPHPRPQMNAAATAPPVSPEVATKMGQGALRLGFQPLQTLGQEAGAESL